MAFSARNRAAAEDVATLALTNPFLPDRIALERRVLGARFAEHGAVWSHHADGVDDSPNFRSLMERTGSLANKIIVVMKKKYTIETMKLVLTIFLPSQQRPNCP